MNPTFISIQNLVLAALLGFLIGVEREKQKQKQKHLSFGGIRTFPLISVLGSLSALLAKAYQSPGILIACFAAIALLIIVTHAYYCFQYKHSGITSEMSAILTFLIGSSTIVLPVIMPISAAILLTLLLSLKKPLHKFSYDLGQPEFFAAIKFVVISFIILPLLPNETIDPWGLFNPYKTWLYAVIISAISFAGYIIVRFIGSKYGLLTTGFVGGIVSSTSTASIFAKRAKDHPAFADDYRIGALLSYISSLMKVALVILLLNQKLFYQTLASISTTIIIGLVFCWILSKKTHKKQKKDQKLTLHNPFTLSFALKFAALLTIVLILVQFTQKTFGSTGVYITSFLSGIAKIDAIAVSMAELAGQSLDFETAEKAIAIAIFISGASKSVYSRIFGGAKFARSLYPYMLLSGVSGLIVSFIF